MPYERYESFYVWINTFHFPLTKQMSLFTTHHQSYFIWNTWWMERMTYLLTRSILLVSVTRLELYLFELKCSKESHLKVIFCVYFIKTPLPWNIHIEMHFALKSSTFKWLTSNRQILIEAKKLLHKEFTLGGY